MTIATTTDPPTPTEAELNAEIVPAIADPPAKISDGMYLAANPREAARDGVKLATLVNVYASNLPGLYEWGQQLTRAGMFVLAQAAATTGLNPLLGHIVMLGGKVYTTEPGIMHVANNDPDYDGYELEPIPRNQYDAHGFDKTKDVAYRCSVYRKSRTRPTVSFGRANRQNIGMAPIAEKFLPEMAQKRAVQRAHSRAFALPFNSVDELGEDQPALRAVNAAALNGGGAAALAAATETTPEDLEINTIAGELKMSPAMIAAQLNSRGGSKARLLDEFLRPKLATHRSGSRGRSATAALGADEQEPEKPEPEVDVCEHGGTIAETDAGPARLKPADDGLGLVLTGCRCPAKVAAPATGATAGEPAQPPGDVKPNRAPRTVRTTRRARASAAEPPADPIVTKHHCLICLAKKGEAHKRDGAGQLCPIEETDDPTYFDGDGPTQGRLV